MGGGAFADLNTPRMPPILYQHARDNALQILRKYYAQAECPIEAPAKIDYGDIDILVTSPLQSPLDDNLLADALGAAQHKKTTNSQTTHFAIPYPADFAETPRRFPEQKEDCFIQLDLHRCSSSEGFTWELFHQAHGDLWNILGGMIRGFGLIVNHAGLYIRLEDVQNLNRDQCRIKLTSSPSETLKFLDLDESEYWKTFHSHDSMFEYAATCRFHDPKRYEGKHEELKSNDRMRSKKRPVFAKWLEEYLPTHQENPPGRSVSLSRGEVVEDAKRVFGVAEVYDKKRAKGLRIMGVDKLWSDIRKSLPVEGLSLGVIMRGVKREIVGDALGKETDELDDVQKAYVESRFDEVAEWVCKSWEDLEKRQEAYEKEKSSQHLRDKMKREKAKEELETQAAVAAT